MHDGEELLGPLGMPFLHPWANRLSDPLDGADVPRDERGLPIHGTHPASWTVEAHDRVPPRPVGRQRGLRPQALGRELDAPVGEAGARDAPHEAILLGDAVGVEQPVQPGLLGAVGLVDRGRDADGEAELAQQRDARARPVEAPAPRWASCSRGVPESSDTWSTTRSRSSASSVRRRRPRASSIALVRIVTGRNAVHASTSSPRSGWRNGSPPVSSSSLPPRPANSSVARRATSTSRRRAAARGDDSEQQ
jgi:hypothetical protein